MKKIIAVFLLFIVACNPKAQTNNAGTTIQLIDPAQTSAGILTVHSPHVAAYNTAVPSHHKLFLMIVGTGGFATATREMDSIIAGWGYHAISIDYKNTVITTVCNNSPDSACFDHFRQEIMFGTPVSDSVNVDTTNSIINRFAKALEYLAKTDPKGGWDEFIKGGKLQWNKIAVGGHSQGAGHAAYIGKHFSVDRVLIFSGPQDYRVAFNSPALWLSQKSVTPASKYYAFLNRKDPFNVSRQLANCAKLMGMLAADSVFVQPGMPVNTNKHILVNDIKTNNPHGSTLQVEFTKVWEYMLKG